jgi:hypothetical protein
MLAGLVVVQYRTTEATGRQKGRRGVVKRRSGKDGRLEDEEHGGSLTAHLRVWRGGEQGRDAVGRWVEGFGAAGGEW